MVFLIYLRFPSFKRLFLFHATLSLYSVSDGHNYTSKKYLPLNILFIFLYFSLVERDLESIVHLMFMILYTENIQLENKQNPFRYIFEIIVINVSAELFTTHKRTFLKISAIFSLSSYIYSFTKLFLY